MCVLRREKKRRGRKSSDRGYNYVSIITTCMWKPGIFSISIPLYRTQMSGLCMYVATWSHTCIILLYIHVYHGRYDLFYLIIQGDNQNMSDTCTSHDSVCHSGKCTYSHLCLKLNAKMKHLNQLQTQAQFKEV